MGRWFNWADPVIPEDKLNTDTHYLGNRPRMRNVMEKCTFCIHRVRKGQLPACVGICPTKALVFGDINDPDSEVSHLVASRAHKTLRPELGLGPNVFFLS